MIPRSSFLGLTFLCKVNFICCFLLLAIWSLPHTIFLRHVLLAIGVVIGLIVLTKYIRKIDWAITLFFCLFVWVIFHYIFLSTNVVEQFSELRSTWVRSFLGAIAGWGIGVQLCLLRKHLLIEKKGGYLFITIFSSFLIIYLAQAVGTFITKGFFEYGALGIFSSKNSIVLLSIIMIPLLLTGLFPKTLTATILLITIACSTLANSKFGVVILSITTLIFLIKYFRSYKFISVFIIIFIAYFLNILYINNPTIINFPRDALIASKIEKPMAYWGNELPTITNSTSPNSPDLTTINQSVLIRTSWFLNGVKLLLSRPLGYGLIHHSFGALALEKNPDFGVPIGVTRGASHSGLLDLALGFGLPVFVFMGLPLLISWHRARSSSTETLWGKYVLITIPLLLLMYLSAELSEKHGIELLCFMTTFFLGITTLPNNLEKAV